jgi:hypothetical protein
VGNPATLVKIPLDPAQQANHSLPFLVEAATQPGLLGSAYK